MQKRTASTLGSVWLFAKRMALGCVGEGGRNSVIWGRVVAQDGADVEKREGDLWEMRRGWVLRALIWEAMSTPEAEYPTMTTFLLA